MSFKSIFKLKLVCDNRIRTSEAVRTTSENIVVQPPFCIVVNGSSQPVIAVQDILDGINYSVNNLRFHFTYL